MKNKFEIIVPTLYNGGIEPKEPKEGDIWQNPETFGIEKIKIYLGNKWFSVVNFKETGYSEKYMKKLEEEEKAETEKEKSELEKYKHFFKIFKEIIDNKED